MVIDKGIYGKYTFFLGSRGLCSAFLGAGFDASGALGVPSPGLEAGWLMSPAGFTAFTDAINYCLSF